MKIRLYILLGNIFLIVLSLIIVFLAKKYEPKLSKVSSKLNGYLYWNALIRFFLEAYLDVSICALINLKSFIWISEFSSLTFNNLMAVLFITILLLLPPFLLIFAACKHQHWQSEEYQKRYGSLIEGAK